MYATLLVTAVVGCCLLLLRSKVLGAVRMLLGCWRAKLKYQASGIPGPPAASSILGHVSELLGPKGPWVFADWVNKYGPVVKVQVLDSFAVILTDPDTIMRITRKTGPGPYLPKGGMYEALEGSLGKNIVTADDGPYWKAVRQATAPCFSMSNLRLVVPLVLELTQRAAERMAQHDSFDITDAAKRITSDVMGHLLYGEDLKGVTWEPNEYLEVFYPMIKAGAAKLTNPLHMWCVWDPEVRHQRRCQSRHAAMAADKLRRLRREPPEPHTIAAHILSAIDPVTGQPLDDSRVKAELATFLGAGFETTSHAITWCLALLAAHPEIQEEVVYELQKAGLAATDASPGRDFQASDLNRLPLLSAVIKETLRLCGPAPLGGSREVVAEEGADICGYHVDEGTIVMLPSLPYGLAQHVYGPDAMTFNPQRWMTAAATAEAAPAASKPAAAVSVDGDDVKPERDGNISSSGSSGGRISSSGSNSSYAAPVEDQQAPEPAGPTAGAESLTSTNKTADASASVKSASGHGTAAAAPSTPDHLAFLTGVRDCIGQNLAKLELQVVLATLLSRFRFSPGPQLEQELKLAAATGQPVVKAVHALAAAFITMQPEAGSLVLRLEARA